MNDTFNRAHANTFKGTGLCGADKDTTEVYFAKHIAIFDRDKSVDICHSSVRQLLCTGNRWLIAALRAPRPFSPTLSPLSYLWL